MAQLFARRRKPRIRFPTDRQRTLLAAATQVTEKEAKDLPKLRQPWQAEVLAYYDRLGACRYPAFLAGTLLSRVRIFVGVRDPSGEVEESEDEKELALLDPLADEGGGHRTLLSTYGQLKFLTGEMSLVNTVDPDDPEIERYELLSPVEWRVKADGRNYIRQEYPGKTKDYRDASAKPAGTALDPDEARVWRLWRKHPTYSGLADAPTRSVLSLYEELLLLQLGARSRVLSRLIRSGILFYDGAISFTAGTPLNPDEDPESDPLFAELIKHVTAAISDPGSAAAIAPLLARIDTGGRPIQDLIHHLQLGDSADAYPETERQQEVLKQIAVGIDFPPEVLQGLSGLNHWGAWLADQQTWQTHGDPDMIAFCADFTAAYLRPLATSEGLARAGELVVGYDAAGAVTDPDQSKTALALYQARAIGKEALREANDYDDSDAPTPEELNEMIGVAVRDGSIALYGIPGLKSGGIEPAPGVVEKGPSGGGTTVDTTGSEPPGGPPATPPDAVTASGNGQQRAIIYGAGLVALQRARELAGSRIRSRRDSCPDCFVDTDGVPNDQLAAMLGPETLARIKAPDLLDLVAGAGQIFTKSVRALGLDIITIEDLATTVELHAARTLCDEAPSLPDNFAGRL